MSEPMVDVIESMAGIVHMLIEDSAHAFVGNWRGEQYLRALDEMQRNLAAMRIAHCTHEGVRIMQEGSTTSRCMFCGRVFED